VAVGLRPPARAKVLILVGAILALLGIVVPLLAFASLVMVRMSGTAFWVPAIFAATGAVGSLLVGTGGFLIFLGFAQARRDSLPWTLVVSVVMVAAGAIGALAGGMSALLWLGSTSSTLDYSSLNLFSFVQYAATIVLQAALIVGLLAVARTLFRKL
jgi:hypothetical protein